MSPSRWDNDRPDEYDDNLNDEEYRDDESSELLPCPKCGALIHEESERCPACGEYVVHESSIWSGRSWLWIVLGLLGVIAVILTLALPS